MAVTKKHRALEYEPGLGVFRGEILRGLRRRPKRLLSKFFYDETGSRLFDQICETEEYYLTRTELTILRQHAADISTALGPRCRLVEYGTGSGIKTRILLDHLGDPVAYIPIDISCDHLMRTVAQFTAAYPGLRVLPVCADYTAPFDLPPPDRPSERTVAFFPGSSIGNFRPAEVAEFLRAVAATCGREGGLLVGVDLKKDPRVLHAAYNDRAGMTEAFNLNLLGRINRELGGEFYLDQFAHYACYNPRLSRVEMHLVSLTDQMVRVGNTVIGFRGGESILTEYSYKYNLDEFEDLAEQAGFAVRQVWTDDQRWFSVQYLTVSA